MNSDVFVFLAYFATTVIATCVIHRASLDDFLAVALVVYLGFKVTGVWG
ncbi:hypothetical protein [Marinomonas sp.]